MIYAEYDFSYDVLFGLGILIGFSFMMTMISNKKFDFTIFLAWMTIINPFLIYFELMELWTEVLFVVILSIMMGVKLNQGGANV